MKVKVSQDITVEFDSEQLDRAGRLFLELKEYENHEALLDGLLALLLFRKLDSSQPGSIERMIVGLRSASATKGASTR